MKKMIALKYHLVSPKYRKEVDLRDHTHELEKAAKTFPVRLDKVTKDTTKSQF